MGLKLTIHEGSFVVSSLKKNLSNFRLRHPVGRFVFRQQTSKAASNMLLATELPRVRSVQPNPLNAKPVTVALRKKLWLSHRKRYLGLLKHQGKVFPSHKKQH